MSKMSTDRLRVPQASQRVHVVVMPEVPSIVLPTGEQEQPPKDESEDDHA